MISTNPFRDHPKRFNETLGELPSESLGFSAFEVWLDILGISDTQAQDYFIIDYWDAWTLYKPIYFLGIVQRVALENAKKYDKLCAVYAAEYDPLENYNRTEEIEEVREPDLTRAESGTAGSTTTASGTSDSTKNQTRTVTENGGNYQEEDVRAVQPFDASSFTNAEKNTASYSGSRTTSEGFSGNPDHIASESSSSISATDSKTETETGTETTTREIHASGNIGSMSSQTMANEELDLAERMNIFKIIERDIAAAVFLQTW